MRVPFSVNEWSTTAHPCRIVCILEYDIIHDQMVKKLDFRDGNITELSRLSRSPMMSIKIISGPNLSKPNNVAVSINDQILRICEYRDGKRL